MKLWISDSQTPTHRLVKLYCQEHSNYVYVGDLSDEELERFLSSIENKNVQKNINLLKYYGYLNIFVIVKN
jgi:spore coat polysaccharide biosynthesis protein SpsF (cytidylyltransferase family)